MMIWLKISLWAAGIILFLGLSNLCLGAAFNSQNGSFQDYLNRTLWVLWVVSLGNAILAAAVYFN